MHAGLAPPRAAWRVKIGLTPRGLDDIGSVVSVTPGKSPVGRAVASGQELLNIEWEGHRISNADELYHTKWEGISGVKSVIAPCSGTLTSLWSYSEGRPLDTDTCLAEMLVDRPALQGATGLVDETNYQKFLMSAPAGTFAEAA